MRKSMALFVIDMLEKLVPNIKTAPTTVRPTKSMGGLKPFATTPTTKSVSEYFQVRFSFF